MNRIERRVAGTPPGATVCSPGQPNNPRRGMLGGGLLSSRMNSSKKFKSNYKIEIQYQIKLSQDLII